jgi:hypothetical protein
MDKSNKNGTEAIMAVFSDFIDDRVSAALSEVKESMEGQEAGNEWDQLLKKAQPFLSKDLSADLDTAINRLNTIEYGYIYRRGFFDALEFLRCGNVPLNI